jgi:hypothetical protein
MFSMLSLCLLQYPIPNLTSPNLSRLIVQHQKNGIKQPGEANLMVSPAELFNKILAHQPVPGECSG